MNSYNNSPQQIVSAVFKTIGIFIKIFFTGPLAFIFLAASAVLGYEQLEQISRFISRGVFPAHYIFGKLCLVLFAFTISAVFLKITFSNRLAKLGYKTIFVTMAVAMVTSAVCELVDDVYTQDFDYYSYPPYILDWPAQSVNDELECDYSRDVIYLCGDFNVTGSGFRQRNCLEFVTAPELTDSYRVEIIYKGNTAEIYLDHSDYEMEVHGRYQDRINIWPMDYDYETPPQDIAYMYQHGINLEYSEPLVVEKIIVYTAYPEKFDTSDIWFNS